MAKNIDWLIIAEKQSQAESYATALFDLGKPSGKTINGGLGGVGLSSILPGNVRITRAEGHLYELERPHKQNAKYDRSGTTTYDDWGLPTASGWKSELEMLDSYPVILDTQSKYGLKFRERDSKAKAIASNISYLIKDANNIIVATDGDAEGEMIFDNIKRVKLEDTIPDNRLYRVLPANMDTNSLRRMFKETRQRYDQMALSDKLGRFYKSLKPRGFARSICDYEFGMTYSLLGTIVSNQLDREVKMNGVWGRLKNTILGHVRQAEIAHDTFVPTSKYRVDLLTENGVKIKGVDSLVYDEKAQAEAFIQQVKSVTQLNIEGTQKQTTDLPPKLFSRAELLIALDKKTKFKNVDWNKALQEDYEKYKVLSYPRSDSQYIGEANYESLRAYAQKPVIKAFLLEEIKRNAAKLDANDPSKNVKFFFDRPANKKWVDDNKVVPHFALVPNDETDVTAELIAKLNEQEKAVYFIDMYQTLSMFLSDTVTNQVSAQAFPFKGTYLFKDTYNEVQEQGWRLLNGNIKKSEPAPKIGQQGVSFVVTEVPAKQPSLLTSSKLLELLKKRNEGTSATRDSTIQTMIKNKGIIQQDKALRLNPDLTKAVDFMLQQEWIDMEQTALWQKDLDEIQTMDDANEFIDKVRKDTYVLQTKIRKTLSI